MLKGKVYQSSDKRFSFKATFIDTSTEQKKTAHMTRVHTCHSNFVADVKGDLEQQLKNKKKLESLQTTVKKFRNRLVETFHEHYDFALYTLKYRLTDHVVKEIRRFETVSVSDSSRNERINVHIKYAYRRTSQRRQSQMM